MGNDGFLIGSGAVDIWPTQTPKLNFRKVIGDLFIDSDSTEEQMESDVPDHDVVVESRDEPQRDDLPKWINTKVNTDLLMTDIFRPGANHISDGMRGGGKTHQSVAYGELMVKGAFPSMPRVEILTNIIFVKRVSKTGPLDDQFVMETPPGVHHITSMEEMFRTITKLFMKYGRTDVMFLLILDEAQNYLLADEYQQDTSINFIKLYGTTRHAAMEYIREHHITDADPREFTTMKMGQNAVPVQFRVGSTSWTRPLEELEIGEYGYDHLANADFRVSKSRQQDRQFDFTRFLEVCSDVPSYKITSVMQHFFDVMDGKARDEDLEEQQQTDPKVEEAGRIARMRELNLTFDQIEYITGTPASTCRLWLKKYGSNSASGEHDGTGSPTRTGSGGSVRPVRGRSPKGDSRTGSGVPETPSDDPEMALENDGFSGDSKKPSVAQNGDSQHSAQQQLNPPSHAPYISIPRPPVDEADSCSELREAPRTVGGQIPPKTGDSNIEGGGAE